MKKFPKYIKTYDGYIGVFQYLDFGEFPVYRFPGGDRIACSKEIETGSDCREDLLRKSIKDYDKLVCVAVKNDPLGFIDILYREADLKPDCARLLREAACVIANLMGQLEIPEKRGI